ncbi:hypothetical protein GCM10029963_32750 [Micromonospora andamanensis]
MVFIDDLDRCLPETVVDTFEAIRLLLGAPRTAFVLAAHQKVVESAVDARYPALRDDNGSGIGAQYLEKMFQQKITVPALAVPEAVTYVNLLLAELHLDRPSFQRVRDHVAAQRAAHTRGGLHPRHSWRARRRRADRAGSRPAMGGRNRTGPSVGLPG